MRSTYIFLASFMLIVGLVLFVSARGRRINAAQVKEKQDAKLDDSWDYSVALPIIPPEHDASLTLEVQPAPLAGSAAPAWRATYTADGHTAHFKMEFDPSDRIQDHGIRMRFGKGRFIAEEGSDNRSILPALAFALGGTLPSGIVRLPVLPFDYVHFGDHMSPIPGGGFKFKPGGDWTVMKLFFDGKVEDDSATVYFALNAASGMAQFQMSNGDYGDPVLRHLASVL